MALGIMPKTTGESSKQEIRITVQAPQPPQLSCIYVMLPGHFNLVALNALDDVLRSSRARIASHLAHLAWESIEATSLDWYTRKGAALAEKFARKGFTLDSNSFEVELGKIKRHHQAYTVASAVGY